MSYQSRNALTDWATLTMEAWMLGFEASSVIATRLYGFGVGKPDTAREMERMVAEKMQALAELQWAWMTGSMGSTPLAASRKTVRHYRRKVRANQQRLSC